MSGPSKNDVPCLSKLYRLQWEKAQDAYVLLYPEGYGEIKRKCRRDIKQSGWY